jgi:hypothetical protein
MIAWLVLARIVEAAPNPGLLMFRGFGFSRIMMLIAEFIREPPLFQSPSASRT